MSEPTYEIPTDKTVEELDNHMRQQGYSDATKVSFWIGKAQQLEAELAEARRENGTTEFADRMNANIEGLGMELTEKQSRIAELKAQLAEARRIASACLSVIDDYIGDTDPDMPDDITNDEIKTEYPLVWVCNRLVEVFREQAAKGKDGGG